MQSYNWVFGIIPMRNALLCGLAAILLVGTLLAQTAAEPFGFKDDKLGMTLEDFKAKHPDLNRFACKEVFQTVTECPYPTTVVGSVIPSADAIFVDAKLAIIQLRYNANEWRPGAPSITVVNEQALREKFGPPEVVNAGLRGFGPALRWDNGVSVIEFQAGYCGSRVTALDVSDILERHFCEYAGDGGDNTTAVWYVHKELSRLFVTRQKEAEENGRKKARSDI